MNTHTYFPRNSTPNSTISCLLAHIFQNLRGAAPLEIRVQASWGRSRLFTSRYGNLLRCTPAPLASDPPIEQEPSMQEDICALPRHLSVSISDTQQRIAAYAATSAPPLTPNKGQERPRHSSFHRAPLVSFQIICYFVYIPYHMYIITQRSTSSICLVRNLNLQPTLFHSDESALKTSTISTQAAENVTGPLFMVPSFDLGPS